MSGQKIEKIIFTGQLLREDNGSVINWFSCLFEYYLKAVTNLPAVRLYPNNYMNLTDSDLSFDVEKFCSFYGLEFNSCLSNDTHEKQCAFEKLYYNKEENIDAEEYVLSLFKDSLVIMHETEEVIVRILEKHNIPFIDLNTDPVRFLDDQLFAFRTNVKDVYNEILKFRASEELFRLYANYIKTYYSSYSANFVNGNAVLFIGQTERDKTLVDKEKNEIYSILNHKEEFRTAVRGFDKIYYKRHPYVQDDKEILKWLESIGTVEIIDENFYKLMCRPDIKKVVSISSGANIEAKYFGKTTENLLRDSIPLQWENNFDKDKYISVYNHSLSLNFWSKILKPLINTEEFDEEVGFSSYKNKIRNSRGMYGYWGYQDFDHEKIKYDIYIENEQKTPKAKLTEKIIKPEISNKIKDFLTKLSRTKWYQ